MQQFYQVELAHKLICDDPNMPYYDTRTLFCNDELEPARQFFNSYKDNLQQLAESRIQDLALILTANTPDGDELQTDFLDEAYAYYQGPSLDGYIIMFNFPNYYYDPYRIVDGTGHTMRYVKQYDDFLEMKVGLITPDELSSHVIGRTEYILRRMRQFNFPIWFIDDFSKSPVLTTDP